MFQVELVVTEKCNLKCKYCYMHKRSSDMTKEVFHNFLDHIGRMLNIYNEKYYHISYFGGEPLLNWELIQYSVSLLNQDPRCKEIVLITNGLELTEEKLDFLNKNNIGISLSFDGLWNNENRPYITGKPSLEKYKENKHIIQRFRGCKVMVVPQNIRTMTENLKFFVEEFDMPSPDFTLVRDDIWSDEDVKVFDIEIKRLADQYIDYIKKGVRCSVGFFTLYILDMLFGEIYGKRPFGCFAGCSGCAYFPNGIFYPCARFGTNNKFPLYDTNKNVLYKDNINILKNDKVSNPQVYDKCKNCELYRYCNAGCTYSQLKYDERGYYCEPIENVCRLLKILYRETCRIVQELKDNKLFRESIISAIQNIG